MDPLTIISIVESLGKILGELAPEILSLRQKGLITDEQQAALMEKYKSLETIAAGQFAGPEWAPSQSQ